MDIKYYQNKLDSFVAGGRGFDRFHNPKNITMALASEAGKLLETFKWLSEEESGQEWRNNNSIREELADIFIYLIRLSDKLEINLEEEVKHRINNPRNGKRPWCQEY
jgi:dCTP diphosphatase